MEIFKRNATGFDSIVIALLKEETPSVVVDLSSTCTSLTPLLVYPANALIEKDQTLLNTKIYFSAPTSDALYVFKCTE